MKGIGVSTGIAIGRAFIIKRSEHTINRIVLSSEAATLLELAKYDQAVESSLKEIESIISNKELNLQEEEFAILIAQNEFLNDPQIRADVLNKIQNHHSTAHDSLIHVIQQLVEAFKNMDDEVMSARSADIQDIGNRILKNLNSSFNAGAKRLDKDTIIIAQDISHSDTNTIDMEHVIGLATAAGSKTSHTATLAKAKGIPAVVACGDSLRLIKNNDMIILDGKTGHVLINPDTVSLQEYIRLRTEHLRMSEALKSLMELSAITADGTEITLMGNISDAQQLFGVLDQGGQGAILFPSQTKFIAGSSQPSEDEQFEFYKKVAFNSNNFPVIVRTIDVAGEMLSSQLKAILRASALGNFKVMFPNISTAEELGAAKDILERSKQELRKNDIAFDETLETGVLIEISPAARMADILTEEADFLMIGTNDLGQYRPDAGPEDQKIEHRDDPFNPAVLRLIKFIIEQAEKKHIPVGIYGEMASDRMAIRLLLGMGLREFSMDVGSISEVKEIILNTSMNQAKEISDKVIEINDSAAVLKYLHEQNDDL